MTMTAAQERLFESIAQGDLAGVDKALAKGADIEGTSFHHSGKRPLHMAIDMENLAMVEHLLDRHADINAYYEGHIPSRTPIMIATENGSTDIMKCLLERGADVTLLTSIGTTLTMRAAIARKNPDAVWELLLDKAYGVEVVFNADLLFVSAKMSTKLDKVDPQALAAMIRRGADWRVRNKAGETILHTLINGAGRLRDNTHIAIVIQNVLNEGVSMFMENSAGISAYDFASNIPEIKDVLDEACKPLAERLNPFIPAQYSLVDKAGKPTDLALYACKYGRLGEVITQAHWPDSRELIRVKQALQNSLPEHYRKHYEAELDTSSAWRQRSSGLLQRHIHPGPKNDRGGLR